MVTLLMLDSWWAPLARTHGLDFYRWLARAPLNLQALVIESPAFRHIVVPHLLKHCLTEGVEYPSGARVEQWKAAGMLDNVFGVAFFCARYSNSNVVKNSVNGKQQDVDLSPLLANPLSACGALSSRQWRHASLALAAGPRLAPLLRGAGGRREYLVLASPALLAARVSLDEAAFLLPVLRAVYRNGNGQSSESELDAAGAALAAALPAVALLRSLWGPAEGQQVLIALLTGECGTAARGLRVLSEVCSAGEQRARELMIQRIESSGYLGCMAQCMLGWTGHKLPVPVRREDQETNGSDSDEENERDETAPDRHRHAALARSGGAHYLVGETIDREEDSQIEFKVRFLLFLQLLNELLFDLYFFSRQCNRPTTLLDTSLAFAASTYLPFSTVVADDCCLEWKTMAESSEWLWIVRSETPFGWRWMRFQWNQTRRS